MLETNEKIESFGKRLVNLNEELEDIKKNQLEILEPKSTITEINKTRFWARQQNGDNRARSIGLKDKSIEIIQIGQQREKK